MHERSSVRPRSATPPRPLRSSLILLLLTLAGPPSLDAQTGPRARDLGVPLDGTPGPLNAITDVTGVEVGHSTIIRGEGRRVVGEGPVRTGVTAILPRGRGSFDPVFAAWFTMNGNGEMTGTTWVEESGFLEGPVLITNTHSVGVVRDAVIDWMRRHDRQFFWALPVVAETYDGDLSDIDGFHVKPDHAFEALDGARGGPVAEGNVGGGTGMVCHQFKGGIGTASRRVEIGSEMYTVGVLVQCNYGGRSLFRVAGVPVGREIPDLMPCYAGPVPPRAGAPACDGGGADAGGSRPGEGDGAASDAKAERPGSDDATPEGPGSGMRLEGLGSIIIVAATDAPLLPHQLKRLVKRTGFGVARMGGIASNGSGDIFLAFSTANPGAFGDGGPATVTMLPNEWMNRIFLAAIEATEEAILNALAAAETMTGANGLRVHELPHDRLREILSRYGRLGAESGD